MKESQGEWATRSGEATPGCEAESRKQEKEHDTSQRQIYEENSGRRKKRKKIQEGKNVNMKRENVGRAR